MEVKPDWGCDSGLFLRSSEAGEAYQVTLDYLPGGSMGGIYGERLTGVGGPPMNTLTPEERAKRLAEYRSRNEMWQKAWKREAWNTIRARIEGDVPHITVWINDQLVTDFTDTANHAAGGAPDGMIAIQMHFSDEKTRRWVDGGFWRWRVIAVKELPGGGAMIDRRNFLQMTVGAAAAAHARPISAAASRGVIGANDRVRVGLIGCGSRGNQVARDWMKHQDSVFVAACDVYKERLDQTVERIAGVQGASPEAYEDYRRILDRKDVDAVFIATPDHWHSPMTLDACAAGKDVYVEKPVSNGIEPALRMIEAARRHNRVVQVGLQQRSWHHFQEARQLLADGYLGAPITHCTMVPPGGWFPRRGGPPAPPQEPPTGLNWELFQGAAERKPFTPARLNWRSWYAYGGGNLSDWGVHLTDVMNWFLLGDVAAPLQTSVSAQYVRLPRDPELVPDSYAVTWQFKDFVASLSNTMIPGEEDARQLDGNHFFGERGVMIVNRFGYEVRPCRHPNAQGTDTRTARGAAVQGPQRHVRGRRIEARLGHAPAHQELPRRHQIATAAEL